MEYVLETNALTKHYRGSIALDGLTMCIPQGAKHKAEGEAWIDFMCSYDASLANLEYIWYGSPNTKAMEDFLTELEPEDAAVLNPSKETLDQCEMFLNLPQDILNLYDELWVLLKS